jgi:DNA-binding NtrC family response regulator
MREMFHVTDVPVLCISGYSSEEAVNTALLLGAAGVLSKPVNLEELLTSVKNILTDGHDPAMHRRRVVVVIESSPHIRGLFRHIFEGMGWSVVEGSDPERLLSVLKGPTPSVIVVSLPTAPREEEALLARLAPVVDRVPVLVIAQHAVQEARIKDLLNDRAVILVRPLVLDKLAEAIERAQRLVEPAGRPNENGPARVS